MSAYIIRGIYFANYHYPLSTSWATGSRRDLCNVQVAQYVKDVQYLELQKTTLLSCYCHHDDWASFMHMLDDYIDVKLRHIFLM